MAGETKVVVIPSSPDVSKRMSKQRRKDTKPEVAIRTMLHSLGFRYRIAWPIPGMPRRSIDIAFTRARVAIFIDGCFWHSCPQHATHPAANGPWWAEKLAKNRSRDIATTKHLTDLGWRVLRIWEHEEPATAVNRIVDELGERPQDHQR